MILRIFPYCVAALEMSAAIVYLIKGERVLSVVWACYAVSAALLGWRG